MRTGNTWRFVQPYKVVIRSVKAKEEALEMIKNAIKLHIEDRVENGESLYEEVFSTQVQIAV